ncbi:hypothetical protein HELRODRAFT_145845, partial [Helobdella robusta]|uniref:ARHGEF1-like PH domain-containing protein n=1 Tax=Helobdella robusta TaxID=6412 RepID=T1EJN3_HELRO
KSILNFVNHCIEEAENHQKLINMQKRLDKRAIEASTDPNLAEFKKLDLTRHRLIFDGPMTWKLSKNKQVDIHAILLEDFMVLLQKVPDSERLVLKAHN